MDAKTKCNNYYSADSAKDVLCENCGGKLWDAQAQLIYWFPIFKTNYTGVGCIHCGYAYQSPWSWENLPDTLNLGKIDTPLFDERADLYNLCPPTVFIKYEVELAKLPDSWRDLDHEEQSKQCHEIYKRVDAEWRAERARC